MQKGQMDTNFLATHRFPLEDGVRGYEMFRNKVDDCMHVVFMPGPQTGRDPSATASIGMISRLPETNPCVSKARRPRLVHVVL